MSADGGVQQTSAGSGRGLAITGIVFAFLLPIVGLILGLIARNRAHEARSDTRLATVAIVISAIMIALELIAGIFVTIAVFNTSR
ncbi:hypothetical protein P5G50_04930 [Leifsonia sp. F6_8S_P_1B]|uniref:DUF4190 domain-containing protein n=1 Tax=Leifsonia williamsii TaxID=3035919 RepID=A0ABT8K8K6_9MICO|nr:hypothetical protein [Leifsonia williamsii]MDN4613791.1 hypothetical protein [Leifsonia williamsii]